jgi:hypothetical protein
VAPTTADAGTDSALFHMRMFFCAISLAIFLGIVVYTYDMLLAEPDLWWHIKTGQWMWQHGAVPTTDPFSHSFAGKPWIAKEWLSQIFYYAAYSAAGWNGALLLSTCAVGLGVGALYWCLSEDLSPLQAAFITVIALLFSSISFTARPHLLTIVLFVVWTYQLFAASGRQTAPRFGWLLILLLWANLHAAFTIGFVIALFAFLDFLERARLSQPLMLRRWLCFLALCPLVTLIHPYGYQAILATWTVVGPNEAVPLISEWQPFNAQTNIFHHGVLLFVLFLSLVSGFRLGIAKSLLLVLLLHLFFTHIRYAFFFFPIFALLIAPELARQFPRLSAAYWKEQQRDVLETAVHRFHRPLFATIAAAFVLFAAIQIFVLRAAPPESTAATKAIEFAKTTGLTGNVMNHYNLGGPLIFHGIPTFLDGRTDQLFLDGFTETFALGPKTAEKMTEALQKYAIGWTIFPPKDTRVEILDKLPGWKRVYSDDNAVIHRRQAKQDP